MHRGHGDKGAVRGRALLLAVVLLLLAPASGQAGDSLSGAARAFTGEIVNLHGAKVRLAGIEAPRAGQICRDAAGEADCAEAARQALDELLDGQAVTCRLLEKVGHGSFIGTCAPADGGDIGEAMLRAGWARARPSASAAYKALEAEARKARRGLWATAAAE